MDHSGVNAEQSIDSDEVILTTAQDVYITADSGMPISAWSLAEFGEVALSPQEDHPQGEPPLALTIIRLPRRSRAIIPESSTRKAGLSLHCQS